MPRKVLVTGGGGYIGSVLTPSLLRAGYLVNVLDTFWFGDSLTENPALRKFSGDMRDSSLVRRALEGVDTVIHLACLSNDPTSDLDPELTREINLVAVTDVMRLAKDAGARRFVFGSSASVYGVRDEPDITEDMELKPITLYSRYKAEAELVLFGLGSRNFVVTAVRNSTVCGPSPRMRLDTIINSFVKAAVIEHRITVEGGQQLRPLISMPDIIDFYHLVITADPAQIADEAFNVSSENFRVVDVARMVQRAIPCELVFVDWTDPRSYHVNTNKVWQKLGYRPAVPLASAIDDLRQLFSSGCLDTDDLRYYNLRQLKKLASNGHLAPWTQPIRSG